MKIIHKKCGIFLLFTLFFAAGAQAQQVTSMRINEVLVINDNNFVDDYGQRSGWIELFNISAGTVNIGGCYLTNDRSNPRKYPIPKGDVLTKIPPRQHVLFWADGLANRGTFHLNFTLDGENENFIALYDVDGKTLVDSIVIPAGQKADISFARKVDGEDVWLQLTKVTPSTNNLTLDTNEKIENFKGNDAWGIGMTVTAMAVVFIGLVLLYLCFKYVGKSAIEISRRRARKARVSENGHHAGVDALESGEIVAAVSLALFEVEEDVHDLENTVITIHKVARNYSPWSSKIYGLRNLPQRK
ncbi:MAG: lamin tail domain-containing protein [Tannerella sp.]|jgi:Na+-transporting methylmalonyl-CoA/oxaloacetate decarboxylase gamma subunit|nr:lamin tail domain-containing protein [Tannerella sp.]